MTSRRDFMVKTIGAGVAGVAVIGAVASPDDDKDKKKKKGGGASAEEVSAPEDLMREHGVLNRILLIYEESMRRLREHRELPPEWLHRSADLVRRFVEEYHEQLEERFIFPEFENRRQMTELVRTLRRQHEAGRNLTAVILRHTAPETFRGRQDHAELIDVCTSFIRMYRPHEAREDTVLFPALRRIVTAHQIHELGERFEEEEDRRFGEGGFEHIVEQVAGIERQLGIHDLDQFTPRR